MNAGAWLSLGELDRIGRSTRPGALVRTIASEIRRRMRQPTPTPSMQLALRILQPAPEIGPLLEWDLVKCDHFSCTLPVRHCLERQAACWPSKPGTSYKVYAYCASGVCRQGAGYRERSAYRPEAVWSKGRYSLYRHGAKEQHQARKALLLSLPDRNEREPWTTDEELSNMTFGATVGTRGDR